MIESWKKLIGRFINWFSSCFQWVWSLWEFDSKNSMNVFCFYTSCFWGNYCTSSFRLLQFFLVFPVTQAQNNSYGRLLRTTLMGYRSKNLLKKKDITRFWILKKQQVFSCSCFFSFFFVANLEFMAVDANRKRSFSLCLCSLFSTTVWYICSHYCSRCIWSAIIQLHNQFYPPSWGTPQDTWTLPLQKVKPNATSSHI